MNVNIDKRVNIIWRELEDVADFHYLGSKVKKEGRAAGDIKAMLQKAKYIFLVISQVWKSNINSIKTKIKIFNSNVKSVLLFDLSA